MSDLGYKHVSRRTLRLDTLIRLRWLAILGQLAALLVVKFGLDFELPLAICLSVLALYAIITVGVRMWLGGQLRLDADRAGWLLAIDIAELAILLGLTGGLQNPFSFLLLGPVLISATALPARMATKLAGLAITCATILVFVHLQLPWASEDPLELPPVYMVGVWLSILLAIGYISVYAWQITEEARQLADALAATELVLAREQHLSQLDGLAAAAAHELGTPLSTIAVVSKDLLLALADSPHAEDARILREQAQRCREILGKLTESPDPGDAFERMGLSALVEEVIAPHRDFGITIAVDWPAQPGEPTGARSPAILYSATSWRTRSISPRSASTSVCSGMIPTLPLPSATTVRASRAKSWRGSVSLTSAALGRTARRRPPTRPDLDWAFSLPKLCWSAPERRFRSLMRWNPHMAPSLPSAGSALILSVPPPVRRTRP